MIFAFCVPATPPPPLLLLLLLLIRLASLSDLISCRWASTILLSLSISPSLSHAMIAAAAAAAAEFCERALIEQVCRALRPEDAAAR